MSEKNTNVLVKFLGFYFLLNALLSFVALVSLQSQITNYTQALELGCVSATFGVVAFVSGIYILRKSRFGWWFSTFFMMSSLLRTLMLLVLETYNGATPYEFVRYTLRLVLYGLILFFFFQKNTLAYFELKNMNRKSELIILMLNVLLSFAMALFTAV